jgi:proteasome lid subunit RPN8/RPN11
MSLRIVSSALAAMHRFAAAGYPHEVCGILAGRREAQGGEVSEIVPLLNERADSPQNRYKVGPLLLLRAEEEIERRGLEIVGYYHSHPDHPSRYSDYDREHALPNMSYAIVSVLEGVVSETVSWRLSEDRTEMYVELIEEG